MTSSDDRAYGHHWGFEEPRAGQNSNLPPRAPEERIEGLLTPWGRLRAEAAHGRRLIDPGDLDEVRNEMYPMLPLPPEWRKLEDGTPAPAWVAAVALSRLGR